MSCTALGFCVPAPSSNCCLLLTHLGSQEANVSSSLTYVTLWHNLSWLAKFWQILFDKNIPSKTGNLDWNIRYKALLKYSKIWITSYNWFIHIWSFWFIFILSDYPYNYYNIKRSLALYQIIFCKSFIYIGNCFIFISN